MEIKKMWFKILLNSRWGFPDTTNSVGFFDNTKAGEITKRGQEILKELENGKLCKE